MIFTYLEITDFMKIKHAVFSLKPSEMVILQGGNGQGKSAVFESMAVILTGHRKSSSIKHYIRRGQTKFNLKATLRKTPEGSPFEIEITCSHKSMPPTNKVVRYEGSEYQNSEYDTFMRAHFDIELLENLTLTMQGDNNLSQFKPSQLRDLLKTVFKISFEQEQEAVHSVAGHYREKQRTVNEKVRTLKETLSILRRDEPILYRPPSPQKIEEARKQVEEVSSQINAFNKELEGVQDFKNRLSDLEVRLREKKLLLSRYDREREQVEARLSTLEDQWRITKKHVDDETSRLESIEEKEELKSKLSDNRGRLKTLTHEAHDIDLKLELTAKGVCPTCTREVPDEWKEQQASLKEQYDTLNEQIRSIEAEIQACNEKWQQRIALETSIERHTSTLESIGVSKQEAEGYLKEIKEQDLAGKLKEEMLEIQAEIDSTQHQIDKFKQEHSSTISQVEGLTQTLRSSQEHLQELENAKRDYDSKIEVLADNNKRKDEIEASLDDLKAEEVDNHHKLEVYEVAEKLVDKYLPSFGVLAAGDQVIKGMLGIIRPVLPHWDIRLAPSRDGVYFEYRENEEGEFSPISMASGFETALCNVAFKLTLTAYYGLPLMILDEIDEAAEDQNSYKVFDSISQFRRAYSIHQIWLVTHKDEVITQLLQEYGQDTQVFYVSDGNFTHTWKGGDMK